MARRSRIHLLRALGLATALVTLATALAATLAAATAQAHGTTISPASRSYVCRFLDRDSEPCATAWRANPQGLYDWMGVLISAADGRHRQLIPDGQLCSAGDPAFGALDRPSTRWLATGIAPGRQTLRWVLNAPHDTLYYRFFITRDGYDPTRPLRWDDLEQIHDSGRRPAARMESFEVDVPQRAGRHVIYSIWQRSDSPEAFYACSDVVFGARGDVPANPPLPDESANQPGSRGGGHGGHEGHGGGHADHGRGDRAARPRRAARPARPLKLSSRGIVLRPTIDDDWRTGYCATVRVENRSRQRRLWKASMRMPHRIDSRWSAVSSLRDGLLRVRGADFNRVLRPGASTTFGFCATRRAA